MDKINLNALSANNDNIINYSIITDIYNSNNNQNILTLNIDKMIDKKYKEREELLNIYITSYNRCINEIKKTNLLSKTDLIFKVPKMIHNNKSYSSFENLEYIEKKLEEMSMNTYKINDNTLFITWKFIEYNRHNIKL